MDERKPSDQGFSPQRLETLADGIFAIAMTLLVLDLKGGAPGVSTWRDEWSRVAPALLAYVFSFFILALYWTGHHAEFHYIRRTDRRHLWLNLLLLMGVALVPYSTSLLASEHTRSAGIVFYSANLIFISAAYLAHWHYAVCNHRLVGPEVTPGIVRDVRRRLVSSTVLMIVALSFALWNPLVSFSAYFLIQLVFIWRTTRTPTGMPLR